MAGHNHGNEKRNLGHDRNHKAAIEKRLAWPLATEEPGGEKSLTRQAGGANPRGTQTLGCRQAPAMAARITSGNGSGMGDGREWNLRDSDTATAAAVRQRRNARDREWEWNHEHAPPAIARAGVCATPGFQPTVMGASWLLDVRPPLHP